MLLPEKKAPHSEYSSLYDLIVPKNNLLRKINEMIDFSFIYEELSNKYCHYNGRNAQSPIRMFKYQLLKTLYDLSDADVVERSLFDMSFKYFLDMTPRKRCDRFEFTYKIQKITTSRQRFIESTDQ